MRQPQPYAIYVTPVFAGVVILVLIGLQIAGASVPVLQGALFVVTLLSIGFAFWDMLIRDIRHAARHSIGLRAVVIAVMVGETVLLFAVTYHEIASYEDQMRGLSTGLDSVYFTMTTLMTIGFGDISATGQLARAVVLIQMIFTVLVLSSSVRLLTTLARGATREIGHEPHGKK